MFGNIEIFDFFKNFPKQIRARCIEEVLIFGIRILKEKSKNEITFDTLLRLNSQKFRPIKRELTPTLKLIDSKTQTRISDNMRMSTSRFNKENIMDTTCLPLKNDNRRTLSTQIDNSESSKANTKSNILGYFGNKKMEQQCRYNQRQKKVSWGIQGMNESLEKENDVIRMADEFLKNPFSHVYAKQISQNLSPGLFDSNIFSTIDAANSTAYIDA